MLMAAPQNVGLVPVNVKVPPYFGWSVAGATASFCGGSVVGGVVVGGVVVGGVVVGGVAAGPQAASTRDIAIRQLTPIHRIFLRILFPSFDLDKYEVSF